MENPVDRKPLPAKKPYIAPSITRHGNAVEATRGAKGFDTELEFEPAPIRYPPTY